VSYPNTPPQAIGCYRHPDRATYLRCTRCQRGICPECMRSAPVGHQCVDCVNEGNRSVRQVTGQFGGAPATQPYLTYALIALNVVMFVAQKALPNVQSDLVLWTPLIAGDNQFYRLVTSGFLHGGIMHILFNMVTLYFMGPTLERALGHVRFIGLYLLSLLGGSTLVYLLSPIDAATLGASGALFGLFGAWFVLARKLNFDVRNIIGLIAINLVITFVAPGISWQGHIGGLITGAVVAYAYAYAPRQHRVLIQVGASVLVLVVLAALLWWRTAALLTGAY
jgi:membrane associated rhomboid family serine protease